MKNIYATKPIGDNKFKGEIHNVKYYQMGMGEGYRSLVFEISGYQGFYVKDFVRMYKNTQNHEVLNLVFYIFSFLLTLVLIVGLKIKDCLVSTLCETVLD